MKDAPHILLDNDSEGGKVTLNDTDLSVYLFNRKEYLKTRGDY